MGTLSLSSSLKPSLVSSRLNSSSSASSSSFPKPNNLYLKPTKLISPPLRTTSPSPLRFANASIEMSQTQESAIRGAESDVMGLLLRERIVFLGSSIDDFVADAIMSQLLLLDAKDPKKDIKLFINSPGGSLRLNVVIVWFSATMAIYDVVQLVRADVSTIALGIAASTASIILGAGTKGKRFAMPNTRIMIHQPLGGASGQAIDVEIQAKEVMHNKNNVTSIIAGCTSRSFEQVLKDIDRDRYMSPIEAVEYGLIDGVIDGDSIIPLEPVPDRVKPRVNYEEISKDPMKFLTPEIPDDEIY
ncbi:ATP-dependent Clp protease-like protein [Arabidopsis thaliana]|nr:ATP-dependent Clp protease-like protein [Arabidopsis thaliana]